MEPRYQELVQLICYGLSNREIAAEMEITENTVKTYIRELFQRFEVGSRTELMARVWAQGGWDERYFRVPRPQDHRWWMNAERPSET